MPKPSPPWLELRTVPMHVPPVDADDLAAVLHPPPPRAVKRTRFDARDVMTLESCDDPEFGPMTWVHTTRNGTSTTFYALGSLDRIAALISHACRQASVIASFFSDKLN